MTTSPYTSIQNSPWGTPALHLEEDTSPKSSTMFARSKLPTLNKLVKTTPLKYTGRFLYENLSVSDDGGKQFSTRSVTDGDRYELILEKLLWISVELLL